MMLGQGRNGSVYLVKYNGKEVAIKAFSRSLSCAGITAVDREVSLYQKFDSPYLAKYYGVISEEEEMCIVMEFAAGGCLFKLLDDAKTEIPWHRRLKWGLDIANGMKYLHEKKVLHRDLNPRNILVRRDGSLMVADFGLSKTQEISISGSNLGTHQVGTVPWMAPEMLNDKLQTSFPVDVYSYGLVLLALWTRKKPWGEKHDFEIMTAVLKGQRPPLPTDVEGVPDGFRALIEKCWAQQAGDRPGWDVIIEELTAMLGVMSGV
jgi:serine/threonine protein kinase